MTGTHRRTELKQWKFTLDQTDYGIGAGWAGTGCDDSNWCTVESYSCWETYEYALADYECKGWFRTHFTMDPDSTKQYLLHFDGIGGVAEIFVNGRSAGRNENRYLPFDLDITGLVKRGDNLIAIVVDNSFRGKEHIPGGNKVEWVLYGGLTHHIYLETRPKLQIDHLRVDARADGSATVTAKVVNLHKKEDFTGSLSLEIEGLPQCSAQQNFVCLRKESLTLTFQIQAENPLLWSPEAPNLYNLTLRLEAGNAEPHAVSERIGFRTVTVEGTDILLNGKKILLKGANRYDEYAPYGICPPEEVIRQDLLEMKKLGMNIIRTHFPQDPIHYRLADEVGIMYMIEVPLNWWYPDVNTVFSDFCGLVAEAVDSLDRTFLNYCNHPCWTVWSVGNECSHSHKAVNTTFRLLAERMRSLDCGRLITYAANKPLQNETELDFLDFLSQNYYTGCLSEKEEDIQEQLVEKLSRNLTRAQQLYPNKPHVITEFGISCVRGIRGSSREGRFAEDFAATYLNAVCGQFLKNPQLRGLISWCWADYRHRRGFVPSVNTGMSLQATYGAYGLVGMDRKPKEPVVAVLRNVFENWQLPDE